MREARTAILRRAQGSAFASIPPAHRLDWNRGKRNLDYWAATRIDSHV
jgi:hypothetical protein